MSLIPLLFHIFYRRAQFLIKEDSQETIPYCIATGGVETLVNFFTSRGQLKDAMLVATVASEGYITAPSISGRRSEGQLNGVDGPSEAEMRYLTMSRP